MFSRLVTIIFLSVYGYWLFILFFAFSLTWVFVSVPRLSLVSCFTLLVSSLLYLVLSFISPVLLSFMCFTCSLFSPAVVFSRISPRHLKPQLALVLCRVMLFLFTVFFLHGCLWVFPGFGLCSSTLIGLLLCWNRGYGLLFSAFGSTSIMREGQIAKSAVKQQVWTESLYKTERNFSFEDHFSVGKWL